MVYCLVHSRHIHEQFEIQVPFQCRRYFTVVAPQVHTPNCKGSGFSGECICLWMSSIMAWPIYLHNLLSFVCLFMAMFSLKYVGACWKTPIMVNDNDPINVTPFAMRYTEGANVWINCYINCNTTARACMLLPPPLKNTITVLFCVWRFGWQFEIFIQCMYTSSFLKKELSANATVQITPLSKMR